ncbi:unnamed protein product [Cylindrotheca closterium]|uniref:Phospholipase B-like n=1 Tax=Cylindrotheca closterium TaxID=2856 RepID=A0AAD2FE73_9STRA|nr:unnamed protein product [Cylindrotheca closterium]
MKILASALSIFHLLSFCGGYESIHSYTPMSLVTDSAAIDQDLHVIHLELKKETQRGWTNAEKIYREGAFSKPVAKILLNSPLEDDLPAKTTVKGVDTSGFPVSGTLFKEAKVDERELMIQYDISEVQANYVNCQVGGNPAPNVGGCFNSTGNLTVNGAVLPYDYDIYKHNVNERTIAHMSIDAEEKMWKCDNCPFPEYQMFYNYFGEFNYADRILTHAFRGEQTYLKHGNMDFGYYTEYALTEFLHKGMSYLNIWMWTIRQMEHALAECEESKLDEGVHYWDEAVAFYTGSRSLIPNRDGNLIWHQAMLRCDEFMTCGPNADQRDEEPYVNIEAFKHFNEGQLNIVNGKCKLARKNKERIVTMMLIPLIQGNLRYSHIIAHEDKFYEKHGAEATLYALATLPFVHDCNPKNAEIIYQNLKSKNTANVDYTAVKQAFEGTYECLNIKCYEIGGIWEKSINDYKYDAFPCGLRDDTAFWMVIGGSAGGLVLLSIMGLVFLRMRRTKNTRAKTIESLEEGDMEDIPIGGDSDKVIT